MSGPVSVIICTKDRPADVARAVELIRASGETGRTVEIVVVEEADAPREIPGVRYVHLAHEGRGFGAARNAGVRAARGAILVFVDDDCEVERGWLEHLTAPFGSSPEVLGVAGAVMVRECGALGYAENILGFPGGGLRYLDGARGQPVPTRHLSTCNCAYRKEAVLRVGGFPEAARLGGEDTLLAERVTALGPCVYTPAAVVYHRARGRLSAIFRWFVRRGRSEMGLLAETMDRTKLVRSLLRSSWTLRGLAALLVLAAWPRLLVLLPLVVVAYAAAILLRFRFALAYPSHRRGWWLVPIVKVTMDLGTEVGRWKALLSRRS